MPNNKAKSKTALQGKKKNGKALHENSRKVKQLVRIGLREDKLQTAKKKRDRMCKADRLLHFAQQLDEQSSISLDQLHSLVAAYLCRYDSTIADLAKERRPGRPKAKQQENLELEKEAEEREYESGFLVPDMTDAKACKELRFWLENHGGKVGFLPQLKLIRILKNEPGEKIEVQAGGALEDEPLDDDMDQDDVEEG